MSAVEVSGPYLEDANPLHPAFCLASVQEWEVSKVKQDKALSNIERGLGTLGELATSMGENLDQQDVLVDAVGEKVRPPTSHWSPAASSPRARSGNLRASACRWMISRSS